MGTDSGRQPVSLDMICERPDDTRALGRFIGQAVREPLVIALHGDLGSGKTVLVQGLAAGLEVPPEVYVTSPTYTLINEYPGRLPVFHVDLYRIDEPDALDDIGIDDLMDRPEGVVAVEWAGRLALPPDGDWLEIILTAGVDPGRRVQIIAHGRLAEDLIDRIAALPAFRAEAEG
jgi:tRNA threonylcarbamoyladenosine biosynthesis protein TsaE